MSIIDTYNEDVSKERPQLRLITGGKGPPPPRRYKNNWLHKLEEGCIFLAADRTGKADVKWIANEYIIKGKGDHCTWLMLRKWNPEKNNYIHVVTWVVNEDFSNDWECVEILDDGSDYRTVLDGGLGSVEETSGDRGRSNQLDEETGSEEVR